MEKEKTPHPRIKRVLKDADGSPVYVVDHIEDILVVEKARKRFDEAQAKLKAEREFERAHAIYKVNRASEVPTNFKRKADEAK